jgi:NAD-dependent SIR2 family protein deacetylase
MRCYTQNIDGLEARDGLCMDLSRGRGNRRRFMKKHFEAPLPQQTLNTDFDGGCEVVPLHGDLDKLRCTLCHETCEWSDESTEDFLEGRAPECRKCCSKSNQRQAIGKRGLAVGSLRPNIVLYGEEHPSNTLLASLVPFDVLSEPEVLIIMGTSLKVFGLQKVVRDFAKAVHATKNGKGRVIFVNRTRPAESAWEGIIDDYVAMDCDDWVKDLNERRPDLSLRQSAIDRKITKSVVKRKRNATEDDQAKRPAKKVKSVAEAPKLKKKVSRKTKPAILEAEAEPQDHAIASVSKATTAQIPTTPRAVFRSWEETHPDRRIFSFLGQLCHLKPSLFFKPLFLGEKSDNQRPSQLRLPLMSRDSLSQSPQRPPFSPITPILERTSPQRLQRSLITLNTPTRRMVDIFREVTEEGEVEQAEKGDEAKMVESEQEQENMGWHAEVEAEIKLRHEDDGIDNEFMAETPSRGCRMKHRPAQLIDEEYVVEVESGFRRGGCLATALQEIAWGEELRQMPVTMI